MCYTHNNEPRCERYGFTETEAYDIMRQMQTLRSLRMKRIKAIEALRDLRLDLTSPTDRGFARALDEYIADGPIGTLDANDHFMTPLQFDYQTLWRSGNKKPRRVIFLAIWRNDGFEEKAMHHSFGFDRMIYDRRGYPLFDEATSPVFALNPQELLKHLPIREREGAREHLARWIATIYPGVLDGEVALPAHPVDGLLRAKYGSAEYDQLREATKRAWHMGTGWAN